MSLYFRYRILLLLFALSGVSHLLAQEEKKLSKFDKFNKKAEALFKILPVPIFSHSSEAGNVFGLAKFNLFRLSKADTLSQPSKISGVISSSTKGRINFSIANDLIFSSGRYMILSYVNFKKQPEYFFGIGNDVSIDNLEQIEFSRWKFSSSVMRKVAQQYAYVGIALDAATYYNVKLDSNSLIIEDEITGREGGKSFGFGLAAAWDSRDNRYNPFKGSLLLTNLMLFPDGLSDHEFFKFELDVRKYYNPWLKHVVAIQATTSIRTGNVPFYELSMLGGEDKMRGYYKGALRDKVLVDAQVEYRLPVWNIFGVTTWLGTGRVAPSMDSLSFRDWWVSYGAGIRIRVDSKNNTNLRLDFGFAPGKIKAFYINFAEAF